MEATLNTRLSASPRRVLLVLVLASLVSAPVDWVVGGITPSFVVYPLALLVGLWRYRRGGGTLFFGIAATVFLLVHLPFTWSAVTGGDNPFDGSAVESRFEWVVVLFALPLASAAAGVLAWRERR